MKWNRFTIKTKTEAEDMIICTLAEIGVEGVEIQDHQPLTEEDKAQMFVDIMPEGPADDGIAYLNFYLEEDADKVKALFRTYFKNGGCQLMVTVVSRGELEDAQVHPEKYPDLIVRVAGYSARFIDLPPTVQAELISRTLYDE